MEYIKNHGNSSNTNGLRKDRKRKGAFKYIKLSIFDEISTLKSLIIAEKEEIFEPAILLVIACEPCEKYNIKYLSP